MNVRKELFAALAAQPKEARFMSIIDPSAYCAVNILGNKVVRVVGVLDRSVLDKVDRTGSREARNTGSSKPSQ